MSSTEPQIPEWLANASFEDLFVTKQLAKALDRPDTVSTLEAIAASPNMSSKFRVLAHELLMDVGHAADPALAETYCRALPDTFAHNAWGMPGHYIERLGRTVVGFDAAALPCLVALFDDQRPLGYFGSEEPTLSGRMQYRVSDMAAFLASQIAEIPFRDAPDTATRDIFIQELSKSLRG